ncbi:MAG TPA: toll/interleukin-1 receptor domain-containing protein, partial [Aggregatilineales bacterium]|nr:toll/interleukin-1 receptor domain-containing protein [Aggregatilineales bacterium]
MVLEARHNPRGLGALDEMKLMGNDYRFPEMVALAENEQNILREAATMLLVQHHLCFREVSDGRSLLIFPTLINQRRPYDKYLQIYDDMTYRVSGAVENIYDAMVVQLSYALQSTRNHCWQNQAQFEMGIGEICGFRLVEGKDGEVDLVLYYGVGTPRFTKLRFQELFEKFLKSSKVMYTRYPPIFCPTCDYQQERTVVIKRIEEKRQHLCCVECGTFIDLKRTEDSGILLSEPRHAAVKREQARTVLRTAFEMALVKIKTMFADREKAPGCFISYAWGSEMVEEWVHRLAHYLREADIEVILDQQWNSKDVGITLAHFVSELERADNVLVIGTPRYRQKFDQKLPDTGSMVAAEIDLINLRLVGSKAENESVLPLILEGDEKISLPTLLQKRVFSDFRQERFYFVSLFNLILTLYKVSERDPVIDELRSFMKHNARAVM